MIVTHELWHEACPDVPLHSYIFNYTLYDGRRGDGIRHGPVPDVLVPEVMHELREGWKASMDSAFAHLREQVENLGKHIKDSD